jgi:hypothetical protein
MLLQVQQQNVQHIKAFEVDKGCRCSTSNHDWFEFKKKNRKKIDHMKLNRCSAYIAIIKALQTV